MVGTPALNAGPSLRGTVFCDSPPVRVTFSFNDLLVLLWVCVAALRLPVVSGALLCMGLPWQGLLLSRLSGSGARASAAVAHELSCPEAGDTFLDQGGHPCARLHRRSLVLCPSREVQLVIV